MTTIQVHADTSYPVIVEHGARHQVQNHLAGADRVAIIHQPALRSAAEMLRRSIVGPQAMTIEVPDAEQSKTSSVLDFCWSALGASGFTRNDIVISMGGGATTDLAGFVAATWLRGVRVVHLPTTLLAMVDAAVGGKTGINTAAGKNLVGSFHSPQAVLCDVDFLVSQHRQDYVGGLAEIIKAGFIRDSHILDLIEPDPAGAGAPHWHGTLDIITRAIQVKADVVSQDLRETAGTKAGREILNYGHTLGHAIERLEGYTWRHGEAVAVGMVYVAQLSHLAGRLSADIVARHRALIAGAGLPVSYSARPWPEVLDAMRIDKKSRGSLLRFVILNDIANPDILEGPDEHMLQEAFRLIART